MDSKLTFRVRRWSTYGIILLALGLVLSACGGVDQNSTTISSTVRVQSTIAVAQQNNDPASGIPLDPTRTREEAKGPTATPLPPKPSTVAAAPTPTAAPANNAGQTQAAGNASGGQTQAASGTTGDAAAGQALFTSAKPIACAQCHANGGRAAGVGPVLAGTQRDDAYIHNQLKNGKGAMPAYPNLTEAQQNDLIAYIRSLK